MQSELLKWSPQTGWTPSEGRLTEAATLVLSFANCEHGPAAERLAELAQRYPGALLAGCSTGTLVSGLDADDDGATALAIHFDHTRVVGHCVPIERAADSHRVGQELGRALAADDLSLVWVLSDGLGVNGTGLVAGMAEALGRPVPIAGGLAGDGARFQATWTALGAEARADQVVAIGCYGKQLRHSIAAVGGWDPFGPRRTVTRSSGSTLFELDGNPALDLYERYLGDEAAELPGSALLYPLQMWPAGPAVAPVVRTVLAIDREARSMTFAGDIPQGCTVQLMRGHHERLVAGAEEAACSARSRWGDDMPDESIALLVSCVGRRLLMSQRTADEVEAVSRALGDKTRCVGFYSYGELAPQSEGGACDLHNQTMTVTLLSEAAA